MVIPIHTWSVILLAKFSLRAVALVASLAALVGGAVLAPGYAASAAAAVLPGGRGAQAPALLDEFGSDPFGSSPLVAAAPVTNGVNPQTGALLWSYPMAVPPPAAGPQPQLALHYDSQSIDGKTTSTSTQTSVVGEGWALEAGGYIQRQYTSCSSDGQSTSHDLCWKTDNATVSFAGHTGPLVLQSKSAEKDQWRFQQDDGSLIEHIYGTADGCQLNGTYDSDCWRITTADGTQYWFGLNRLPGTGTAVATKSTWTVPVYGNNSAEPCHTSTFSSSSCVQAWRWNLDWVVDVHGVGQALYYNAETNRYAKNSSRSSATTYTRGGSLSRIDYGLDAAAPYATNAASSRVLFTYGSTGRCSSSGSLCTTEPTNGLAKKPAHPSAYPDVPFSYLCTGSTCVGKTRPTFWTVAKLASVTTQSLVGAAYAPVDIWTLSQSFPNPGDGTRAALWLKQVTHTSGSDATLVEPPTIFTGAQLHNRLSLVDGYPTYNKYRLQSITNPLGGVTSVQYSAARCTAGQASSIKKHANTNTALCAPRWWTPSGESARLDLFHTYVVSAIVSDPHTGGARDQAFETSYVYTGAAWRYETSPFVSSTRKTWNTWAGFAGAEVRVGPSSSPSSQQVSAYTYFQGMDGDRATTSGGLRSAFVAGSTDVKDSLWFAGRQRSAVSFNAATPLSTTVFTPWASPVIASLSSPYAARLVGDGQVRVTKPMSTGGSSDVTTAYTHDDDTGLVIQKSVESTDHAADECESTTYASGAHSIVGLPSEVLDLGVSCPDVATAHYPSDVVSHTRTYYDGLALGDAPTAGDLTATRVAASYSSDSAASADWVTTDVREVDAYGRTTSSTDAGGNTTTTAYVPSTIAAGSGLLASTTETNPAPFLWTTTTTYEPRRSDVTSITDPNGIVTSIDYDGFGRRVAVWTGENDKAGHPTSPSYSYEYDVSASVASSVVMTRIGNASRISRYDLVDGFGRTVQKQAAAEGTGAVISDVQYDDFGRVAATNAPYWATVTPSTAMFVPLNPAAMPALTEYSYDTAGRITSTSLRSLGTVRFHTDVAYQGTDRTDVTPPSGGIATTSVVNSAGQLTRSVEYAGAAPSGTHRDTTYAYDSRGNLVETTAPDGTVESAHFNLLGQQTSATDPDTGTTTRAYDAAGNPVIVTDARGVVLAYNYDELGRPTSLYSGAVGPTGSKLAAWSYDTEALGTLSSSTRYVGSAPGDPGLGYTRSIDGYTADYQPTGETVSIPAGAVAFAATTYSTSMAYDSDGSLATTQLPAAGGLPAEVVHRYYTSTGRESLVNGLRSYGSALYGATGTLSALQRTATHTSLSNNYGRDNATGAVLESKFQAALDGVYSTPRDDVFARTAAGTVSSATSTSSVHGTDTQCFSYGAYGALAHAWTPTTTDCTAAATASTIGGPLPYWASYDRSADGGLRLGVTRHAVSVGSDSTTDTYSYSTNGSAPHRVLSVSSDTAGVVTSSTFTYDAAGNMLTRNGQTYTYDELGQLASASDGSRTETNIYDADGALLLRIDSDQGATLYLGDTELHIADGSAVTTATRTYTLAGQPVAERVSNEAGDVSVYWVAVDESGSPVVRMDVLTGDTTLRSWDSFGVERSAPAAQPTSHGYQNQPISLFTGLVQLGARSYDPALATFADGGGS